MFRPRVIPVLLLQNKGLVKTKKFSNPRYIGDPINAVKIFNDLEVDELVVLDITASNEKRVVSSDLVQTIGDEAFMPFAVGGGIGSLMDITELIKKGAEKVVINTGIIRNLTLLKNAADEVGSQSIIVAIDINKDFWGRYCIYSNGGKIKTNLNLEYYLKTIEENGAGEILINTIYRDGTMQGYDLDLIKLVSKNVNIPIIACGGAGNVSDFQKAVQIGGASAVAAGSMFVFHGLRNAVLINYPNKQELIQIFK
jgi:imidazole glycerol-phosphate synthase subunit HisF